MAQGKPGDKSLSRRRAARSRFNRLAGQLESHYGWSMRRASYEVGLNQKTYWAWRSGYYMPRHNSQQFKDAMKKMREMVKDIGDHHAKAQQDADSPALNLRARCAAAGEGQLLREAKIDRLNEEERKAGSMLIAESQREEYRGRIRGLLWYAGGMVTGAAIFGAAAAAGMV